MALFGIKGLSKQMQFYTIQIQLFVINFTEKIDMSVDFTELKSFNFTLKYQCRIMHVHMFS